MCDVSSSCAECSTFFACSVVFYLMDLNPDEYGLALRAREGDREALSELADRLRLWLFAVAKAERSYYEDAQDAVSAALLRVCLGIESLREPRRLRQWAAAIVRNEVRRIARRRGSELRYPVDEPPGAPAGDETAALRLDVERALRRLPVEQARALSLFYLAGVPIREIAHRTGRPEGTVKSWLHHGRRGLAREMEEYGPMTDEWTAIVISSELEPAALRNLTEALRAGGWDRVNTVSSYAAAATVVKPRPGEEIEFHLPPALTATRFIVLDEWVEGHSAFELLPILNATVERKSLAVGLLVEVATDTTSFAAWASGVDLFLDKPVVPGDFQRFAAQMRKKLESNG